MKLVLEKKWKHSPSIFYGIIICNMLSTNEQKDVVDRAEFEVNSMLVRKDFYSYTRIFSEN